MSQPIDSWQRHHYVPSNAPAFLFYVVFGDFKTLGPLDAQQYRSLGIPDGISLHACSRQNDGEYIAKFCEGYAWEQFSKADSDLSQTVRNAPGCVILKGSVPDSPTLDYFRDTIGLLTFLLDQGGVAIYDPFLLVWWRPTKWHEEAFAPAAPMPLRHVAIFESADDDASCTSWFHTRGMRKFGRPDISVRGVPHHFRDPVIDLCNRFIVLQAEGGVVLDGETVRMKTLPHGGIVRHQGDIDDPDFNNVHFEVVWPEGSLLM